MAENPQWREFGGMNPKRDRPPRRAPRRPRRPTIQGGYNLGSVFHTLRRRWVLVAAVALAVMGIIGAAGFVLPPRYKAEAFVRIDPSNRSVLDISAAYGRGPDSAFVETEVSEIISRPVAEAVVVHLNLQNSAEFGHHKPPLLTRIIGSSHSASEAEEVNGTVNAVLSNLQVAREGTSYRVAVRFTSESAARSAEVANAFVDEYLDRSQRLQSSVTASQSQALNGQLRLLAESVRTADDELAKYRASTGLARARGSSTGTVNDQQLALIASQAAAADASAAEANSRAEGARRQAAEKGPQNISEVLASSVVAQLRKQRAETSQEEAQILLKYGPLYPASVRISQQLKDLDLQIDQEAQRVMNGLESNARTSAAAAKSLHDQLQNLKGEQARDLRASVQADSLERDADAKRAAYERVAKAAQQVGQDIVAPPGRLSSLAVAPLGPSFPNKALFLAAGVFIGALFGLAVGLIADSLDHTVRQPRQIVDSFSVPCLASIPQVLDKELRQAGAATVSSYVTLKPRCAFTEALRDLRTALVGLREDSYGQIICITSALPKEGKSTLALSLARLMAVSGDKVVLIDGDQYNSSLRPLAKENTIGVLEILKDKSRLPQALTADIPGLHLLLQSTRNPETRDLMGGPRMQTLLNVLRQAYRFVIIDAPPVLAVADACALATASDATLLCMRWGHTPKGAVQAAIDRLHQAEADVAGGVLLQVDLRARAYLGDHTAHFYNSRMKDYYRG